MASHDEDPLDELRTVGMTGAAAVSRVAEILIRNAQDDQLRRCGDSQGAATAAQQRYEAQAQVAERLFEQAAQAQWMRDASPAEIAAAWRAARTWAEVDAERFTHHARAVNDTYRDEYGVDLADVEDRLGDRDLAVDLARGRAEAARDGGPTAPDPTEAELRAAELELSAPTAGRDARAAQAREDRDGYDTAARRERDDAAMREAGVPDEAREAKQIADHLNGRHPHQGAAGPGPKTRPGRGAGRAKARTRGTERGR